jgi:hypothetical protein
MNNHRTKKPYERMHEKVGNFEEEFRRLTFDGLRLAKLATAYLE